MSVYSYVTAWLCNAFVCVCVWMCVFEKHVSSNQREVPNQIEMKFSLGWETRLYFKVYPNPTQNKSHIPFTPQGDTGITLLFSSIPHDRHYFFLLFFYIFYHNWSEIERIIPRFVVSDCNHCKNQIEIQVPFIYNANGQSCPDEFLAPSSSCTSWKVRSNWVNIMPLI